MKTILKIIRRILYGAAIASGLIGLYVGGRPVANYVLDQFRDPQYHDYNDGNYLEEPEIIFLLSMTLLTGVCIAMALEKGIQPASSPPTGSSASKPVASAPVKEMAQPAVLETLETPGETADEKLTRLLRNK